MQVDESSFPKDELRALVDLLSPDECEHLLRAVQDVAAGQRFWESDVAVFYNEYVKTRSFQASLYSPTLPMSGDGIFAPIPVVKSYPDSVRLPLPPPEYLTQGLTDLLVSRRSERQYTGQPISLVQLSTLLRHGCGVTGMAPAYGFRQVPLRTFPSAGGLQSPELYLFALAVEGVGPGLYHYQPVDHVLEAIDRGNHVQEVCQAAYGQPGLDRAAVVFVVVGCYERLRWKYGPRSYRYMCLDAGFMSENLHLAGTALGLGVCAIAGFVDEAAESMLGLNGQDEIALMLVTVGVPEVVPPLNSGPPPLSTAPPPVVPPGSAARPSIDQLDALYATVPPWEIGRPQPAFVELAERGAITGRVLDVGCGSGQHALMAAGLGQAATGIDAAPAAIAIARRTAHERGLTARFIVWDALQLGIVGEQFDTVLDCGLFHVFSDAERSRFVNALRVVIPPGGRYFMLCFSDRQPGGWPPRRVTEDEIRASFADGWQVDAIDAVPIATNDDPNGAHGWRAMITRV